jgi:hypothetical protein
LPELPGLSVTGPDSTARLPWYGALASAACTRCAVR